MKILYLDFDGVLHHEDVYFHQERGIYMNEPGHSLFEWMPILDELLAPHPDVKIILSTSWVPQKSFDYAKRQLSATLQKRVIGSTFNSTMSRYERNMTPRGVQIQEDVLRRSVQRWFAIDDDTVYWPEKCLENLVATDGALGINDVRAQDAIRAQLRRLAKMP